MRWQYWAKLIIALTALATGVAVAATFRRRAAPLPAAAVIRTDPKAILESTSGRAVRFNRAHEDIRVEYERQLAYADGSTKLLGIRVTADDRGDGRSFTLTGDEGEAGKDEITVTMTGHVRLVEADGFTADTDHATYDSRDSVVRAPGQVRFLHGRLSGSGVGLLYDKNADVLTILDQAVLHMAPDAGGRGAALVRSGTAVFARTDKRVRLDGGVHVERPGQVISAGSGIAQLSQDEQRIEMLELHGGARVGGSTSTLGGLESLAGRDVALRYAADGQALEHATIGGDASLQFAGGPGRTGRQIAGGTLDVALAPDGETPTALVARDGVQLTLPADGETAARTIRAMILDATGEPGSPARGLTKARFAGDVEYREKSATVDRAARASRLDVGLKAALSAFDDAAFSGGARFTDQKVTGTAASVRYLVDRGALELAGSEPALPVPHVSTDRIAVDAAHLMVTLAGPSVSATGGVKSVLQPPPKSGTSAPSRLPGMLKQDEAVNVTAGGLEYDAATSLATYSGDSQLWQTENSIKAGSIAMNGQTGDLTAKGSVVMTTMLEQLDKDKKKERVRSTATAQEFKYEDEPRRMTYVGDVHVTGSQSDMTASSCQMYLKASGHELDQAVCEDPANGLTLREQGRRTGGSKMTYRAADERYDVTGVPVTLVDQCGRSTTGRTLTFRKATDTIQVDGNDRIRTTTTNGAKCQ